MSGNPAALLLLDYAIAHPEGFTNEQACGDLGWNLSRFNDVVNRLRAKLGPTDRFNLTCDPGEPGARWVYRLVDTLEDIRPWHANRLKDAEGRLTTMLHMARPIAAGTDGRTVDGKIARRLVRVVGRLLEDIAEIRGELPM
jgi:hypothetical protein